MLSIRRSSISLALAVLLSGCASTGQDASRHTGTILGKVLDEQGRGVLHARVSIADASKEALTGPNGSFVFYKVPVGMYILTAEAAGFEPSGPKSVRIDEAAASQVELNLFRRVPIDRAGAIARSVVDERGSPIQYATAFDMHSTRAASTDAGGHFLLSNLPVGTYAIKVRIVGFATEIREGVQVVGRDTTKVVFKLKYQPVQMKTIE